MGNCRDALPTGSLEIGSGSHLPHISVHIVEAPGVWYFLTHRMGPTAVVFENL